jgi:isoamylase
MKEQNWDDDFGKSIAVFLNGDAIADRDVRGMRITDDSFLLAFNAHSEDIEFTLPGSDYGESWSITVDTSTGTVEQPGGAMVESGGQVNVAARSLVVLQRAGS